MLQFVWEGLEKALTNIGQRIADFFIWLGSQIYYYLIAGINRILDGLEFVINTFRNYLPLIVTVVLAWFMASKTMRSETMSLKNKVLSMIASPFLAMIPAAFLDVVLPKPICLPRIPLPSVLQVGTYPTLPGQYIPSVSEEAIKPSFVEESVQLIDLISISESFYGGLYTEETVVIS